MGCYLVDLCGKPVDQMDPGSRRCICEAGEARLARRLQQLRPKIVITVVRSIGSNVRRAEASQDGPGCIWICHIRADGIVSAWPSAGV